MHSTSSGHNSEPASNTRKHTEQRPAERIGHLTPEQLVTALESIPAAFVALDTEWRVTYINQQAELLLRHSREALLGKQFWEVFPETGDALSYIQCQQAVITGKALHFEGVAPGLKKWLRVHVLPTGTGLSLYFTDITEQKQAEAQLQFQAIILRNVRDAVIVTNAREEVIYWNEGARFLFGYTAEDMLGRSLARLFPTLDPKQLMQGLGDIMAGKAYAGEWQAQRKDGTGVWIEAKAAPLLSSEGETVGLIGVARDITERKQAQEANAKLAAIVEAAADAIIGITTEGIITSWNAGAERVFGYSVQEAVGKPITMLSSPEHEQDFARVVENMCRRTGMHHFETTRLRKDGTLIPVSIIASPLKDASGAMIGVSAIARDISEQKRLEAEIRRQQQQLEAIFQHVADGIIVQDGDGKVVYANQAVLRLIGAHSMEALLTTSPLATFEQFDMTDEQGHPFSWTSLSRNRAVQEEAVLPIKLRWVRKHTRQVRWIALTVTTVYEADHLPYLLITVMRDITKEKELEQRKDDFIINVNHELRTPLAAVYGYLELLKDHHEQLDAATQQTFLSKTLNNCQELIRLVDTVTEALQITQTVKSAHPEELPLAQLVREVLDLLDPQQAQAYTIRAEIPEQLRVWAKKEWVCQILRNLLSNVFKYTPRHTPVVIRAAPSRDSPQGTETVPQIRISVKDAGPGIPPAEQPLLFEKFVRLNRDLSGTVRGTGLGLYISKQLVEAMGGRMWVESSGRAGEGSCFCFTLPAAAPVPTET